MFITTDIYMKLIPYHSITKWYYSSQLKNDYINHVDLFLMLGNNNILKKWGLYTGLGQGVYSHTASKLVTFQDHVTRIYYYSLVSGRGCGLGLHF